jgi:CRP/FNR family cyclic AMP-dependent transcriptional regulator
MAAADVLRGSALFRGFTETGIQILASIAVERAFAAGSPVFLEDAVSDALLLIGEGQVGLSAKNASGDAASLGEVGPGDSLGALSLVSPGRRMCSATSLSRVSAVEIRHADFHRLLGQKPQACLKLLMNVIADFGQRLQENREGLRSLVGKR